MSNGSKERSRDAADYLETMDDVEVALQAGTVRQLLANADYELKGIKAVDETLMGRAESDDMGDIKIRSPEQHFHQQGLTLGKALMLGGLLAGTGGLGAGLTGLAMHYLSPSSQAVKPADSEYEVRFYDADGKLIPIPQKK